MNKIIIFCALLGVCAFGESVREVLQGKSPEYYLGTFLYAIGVLSIASMIWYMHRVLPKRE